MSEEMIKAPRTNCKVSKIVRFGLEQDVIDMRKGGDSFQTIADACCDSGRIPEGESVDKFVVMRFLERYPNLKNDLMAEATRKFNQIATQEFDVIYESTNLFRKTKTLLELMEDDAYSKGRYIDPYRFKAIASEMREMLTQMGNIQKEVNDYNNIRKFMEIVIEVIQAEAPQALPRITEQLKIVKGTKWFAEMMSRGGKGSSRE